MISASLTQRVAHIDVGNYNCADEAIALDDLLEADSTEGGADVLSLVIPLGLD